MRIVIVLGLIGCLTGCTRTPAAEIEAAFARAAAESGAAELNLDTVAVGQWSRLFIFAPYTSEARIESCTGLEVSARHLHGISMLDNRYLILVQSESDRFSTRAISRADADFRLTGNPQGYEPSNARFVVRPTPHGNVFAPASTSSVDCGPRQLGQ
jgi:hypothetical protein